MTTQIDTINSWVAETRNDLVSNYKSMGLRASGNWENQLEERVQETGDGFKVTFLGSKYTEQLINGRRPNSNPDSIKSFVGWAGSTFLAQWVKDKGIDVNPFAVAYKIAREGIQVPNSRNQGTLLSDVFTSDRINSLLNDLSGTLVGELKTDIPKILKNGGN